MTGTSVLFSYPLNAAPHPWHRPPHVPKGADTGFFTMCSVFNGQLPWALLKLLLLKFQPFSYSPRWHSGKEPPAITGRCVCVTPVLGRSPGEGNGNPFQYSFLGNLLDRGAWQAVVRGVSESWTWLSTNTHVIINLSVFSSILTLCDFSAVSATPDQHSDKSQQS